jgi:glycosyltransferase involved in cell wall biosynthesis
MAREIMGVPSDASVLLFVSHRVENKHKGLPLLIEAMTRLRGIQGLFLLILGEGSHSENLPVASASLGFVSDERLLSLAYSAADLYLLPTLMDNAPNTALEALACGLPVVTFRVGGVPEIVRDGSTGVLVEQGDAEALANAIKGLLGDQDRRRQMAENCRRIAVEEYALEVQARRYAELYASLVDGAGHGRRE